MAVGAQQDRHFGPVGADGADQAADKGADLVSAWPLGWPQQGGDEPALAVEDDDRLKAVIVMMGVEQAPFLAAVHAIEGVVDVEHDTLRHLPEGGTVLVDQSPAQAHQRPGVGPVFQPRDRRLRTQRRVPGPPVERQLEHRVVAQRVGIVAVDVTCGDHQQAKANDLGRVVHDPLRRARGLKTGRQPIGHPQPALSLTQGQQAAFRRQSAAVKAGDDRLAVNR